MDYQTRKQALKLYASGLNNATIAVLLNVDRDEVEIAINDAETHGASFHFTGGTNDDATYA